MVTKTNSSSNHSSCQCQDLFCANCHLLKTFGRPKCSYVKIFLSCHAVVQASTFAKKAKKIEVTELVFEVSRIEGHASLRRS